MPIISLKKLRLFGSSGSSNSKVVFEKRKSSNRTYVWHAGRIVHDRACRIDEWCPLTNYRSKRGIQSNVLILELTKVLQSFGWNSAAVITSARSSMFAGFMSTISEKGVKFWKEVFLLTEWAVGNFKMPQVHSEVIGREVRFVVRINTKIGKISNKRNKITLLSWHGRCEHLQRLFSARLRPLVQLVHI